MIILTLTIPSFCAFGGAASVGASIGTPAGLALDAAGTFLYVCDSAANAVRRVALANGAVTLVAGGNSAASVNGVGAAASFNGPADLVVDHARNVLYVAEDAGRRVRRIALATNNVTTVATLRHVSAGMGSQ